LYDERIGDCSLKIELSFIGKTINMTEEKESALGFEPVP
jgi:hypothetical protein